MPDIGKLLRDEITRLAQREAKIMLADTAKTVRQLKREMVELRKSAAKTNKLQSSKPAAEKSRTQKADSATTTTPSADKWFTSNGIKSMRQRLGLSQKDFSRLCDVGENTVSNWEVSKNKGKLNLQQATLEKLSKVRSMSLTTAKKTLAEKAAKAG